MEQEQFPLLVVPPVGQSVLLVPFGSPARTLLVRVLAQEGRNELCSATLGVTVVGEDKWLQELFCHCCGVQVADVGCVADVAAEARATRLSPQKPLEGSGDPGQHLI